MRFDEAPFYFAKLSYTDLKELRADSKFLTIPEAKTSGSGRFSKLSSFIQLMSKLVLSRFITSS